MSAKRRNTRRHGSTPLFFSIGFRVLLIVMAAALVLSYISVYVNPTKFSIPMFFGMFFIPIAAANLLLFIIALIRKSRSAWIPVIALLPFLLYSEAYFRLNNKPVDIPENSLKIESYNIGMCSSSKEKLARTRCRDSIMAHIRRENPDIVCFQEFFADTRLEADTILANSYPYRHCKLFRTRSGNFFGNMTLSKYRIFANGEVAFSGSTNLSIFTDIDYKSAKIRVYNNHLESYNLSFTTLIKRITSSGRGISDELISVHDRMKGTSIKRSEQVNMVLNDIEKSRYPAIICGDFNDTPMSYTYHKLASDRKDTFIEGGRMFGATFIPFWPMLRIDYILIPREWEALRHTTHRIEFSDHYPITAEIEI